jgi:hypothetical protein
MPLDKCQADELQHNARLARERLAAAVAAGQVSMPSGEDASEG